MATLQAPTNYKVSHATIKIHARWDYEKEFESVVDNQKKN